MTLIEVKTAMRNHLAVQVCGATAAKPLRFDDTGIVGIAKYLIKDPVLSKRWCASRNLEQPKESTRDGRVSQKRAKEIYLTEHACRGWRQ